MQFRHSLRSRVALAFALFGAVLGLLLATGIYVVTHDLELRLINETLDAELDDTVQRYQADPNAAEPDTRLIRGFVIRGGDLATLPPFLQDMGPGYSAFQAAGHRYHVKMEPRDGVRFYVMYDTTGLAEREHRFIDFLGAGVVLTTLFAALGGLWLTGRVISPVTDLAEKVKGLSPSDPPPCLADDYPDDEVGGLARAFDRYLARLQAFIDRERAFTADVSHELRTPLAVISGAGEVLLADRELADRTRQRVERIMRAQREMSEVTTALLVLAREPSSAELGAASSDVLNLLHDVVENHRYLLRDKPVTVELDTRAGVELPVEGAVLRILLGNLIHNAFAYTDRGRVKIRLGDGSLMVEDTGIGIPADEVDKVFHRHYRGKGSTGAGIGLSLVKRICERYGWDIRIDSRPGEGTRFDLHFGTAGRRAPASAARPALQRGAV